MRFLVYTTYIKPIYRESADPPYSLPGLVLPLIRYGEVYAMWAYVLQSLQDYECKVTNKWGNRQAKREKFLVFVAIMWLMKRK